MNSGIKIVEAGDGSRPGFSVFAFVFLLKKQKLCFGWLWGWKVEGSRGRDQVGCGGCTMAEAGRMGEEEGAGKVGRVALNNVALHAAFRVCVSLFCLDETDGSPPRSLLFLSSFLLPN